MLRTVLYAAGALAGVYVVDQVRPVDARAALGAGLSGLDDFSLSSLKGAGEGAVGALKGQIRNNIITGVVAGCVVAGLVDALVMKR